MPSAVADSGYVVAATGGVGGDPVRGTGCRGDLDGAGPQIEAVVEHEVVLHVADFVDRPVLEHHRAFEHQPGAGPAFDQQEADRAVRKLSLEPDVQSLPAGHRAHAAGAVALAVPPVDAALAAADRQHALVPTGLDEMLERRLLP